MLKKITNGQFRSTGIIFFKWHFHVGKLKSSRGYSPSQYQNFIEEQKQIPVNLMDDPRNGNRYWAFQGKFYVENENYTAQEIQALIFERKGRRSEGLAKRLRLWSMKMICQAEREYKSPMK